MKVKFGLIGCGKIGTRHAKHINDNKRAELVCVYDKVKSRAKDIARKHKCKVINTYDEMFKQDIDIISICTPSGLHASMSIRAMVEGFHVLCEKPMSLNLIDADRICETERNKNRRYFLVKQNRYNPPIVALKDAVCGNKLGKITIMNCNVFWNRRRSYYTESDWKGTMNLDGGALMTQCSHFLDLMLWIGGEVQSVYARMANLNHPYIETEDTGFIIVMFKNGCFGSLQYTNCTYKKNLEGSMTILGTKGSIKVDGEYLNTMNYWNVDGIECPEIQPSNPPNDYGSYKGSMSNHDKVIENVVGVLLDGESIQCNSRQGRESIEVMQAAYISALTDETIFLPLKGKYYGFRLNERPPISGKGKKK